MFWRPHPSHRATSPSPHVDLVRMARVTYGLLLLFFFSAYVTAQPRFDSWTTDNGLPQNSVRDILQTRDGYLWLATEGGLVRFDGMQFVTFDRSVPGIASQRIGALHEDRRGTLWAGTWDGMLIRYQDGRFTTYTGKDGLPRAGLPGAGVVRIEEDDGGDLWVTWIDAVTRFDGQRFTHFVPEDFDLPMLRRDRFLYLDSWWKQDGAELRVLIQGEVRTLTLPDTPRPLAVTGVNVDRRGNLWIRTAGSGVLRIHGGGIEQITSREGLPHDTVEGVFTDVGKDGVWFFDASSFRLFRIRGGAHELLNISEPRALHVDREGNTWIGTIASGLHRIRDEVFSVLTEREGLSLNRTYPVLQDRAGAIWIGTWDGGLNKYVDGRVTVYDVASGLPSDRITCIYEDSGGRLWVGTDRGLTYWQGSAFQPYKDVSDLLTGSVWAIQEVPDGAFWFATDAGLVRQRDGVFTTYTTEDGLSHDRISALLADRRGALWIGAYHGVTRLRDGVFTTFGEAEGLIGNEVRAFHQDVDGFLWIGTYDGGLYRLDGDRLTRYTRQEGLHDNGVFQILEDDHGYLWMGSNRGISRVSRRELNELASGRRRSVNPILFGTRDGLESAEVNGGRQPAGLRTADGRLWFPTMGGIATVDPSRIRSDDPPIRALIEQIRVAGEVVDAQGELRVRPDAATFEIAYTAPTFVKPEHVRFRYRLVGLSDDWIDAGDRRSVSFHRVPPGHYTFVLAAANHTGVWTQDEPTLAIAVLPPFWGTWWFRALVAGAGASALLAVPLARVRRLRREQAQRSVYLQELIDSQERERRRTSQEMHDSIGYDLARVRRCAQEGRDPDVDDTVRQAFDEILVTTDRIHREMTRLARGLRPYHLDRIGLTRSIEALIEEIDHGRDLELTAEIASIDDVFQKDSEIHIYRIVQEGLSNMVKHSRARRGRVTVAREPNHVEIRIDDDGEGLRGDRREGRIPEADGLGLIGIYERAQLLGGEVRIAASQWRGTSIVVRLKVEEVGQP